MINQSPSIYSLIRIETPRLIIRPVALGDEIPLNKAINNSLEILREWKSWAQDPSLAKTREFVERGITAWKSGYINDFPMALIYKADNIIISASGYNDRSNSESGLYEIRYWCDINYQGQGLITEATNALTKYALDYLHAKKVVLKMLIENIKSRAVAERLNFILGGVQDACPAYYVPNKIAKDYVYYLTDSKKLPELDIMVTNKSYN